MKLALGLGINARAENLEGMGGFVPADISDLTLHFDASTITGSHGDSVTAWANSGSTGATNNASQSSSANQPTLDKTTLSANSVSFDNSNDVLNLANVYVTTNQTFTFFAAFRTGQAGSDVFFAGDIGNNLNFIQLAGANGVAIQTKFKGTTSGSNNNSITTKTDGTQSGTGTGSDGDVNYAFGEDTFEILVITRDASEAIRFVNKEKSVIATDTSDATNSDTNFRIERIGLAGTGGSPYDGLLGELGIYDKVINSTETNQLIDYLTEKYT